MFDDYKAEYQDNKQSINRKLWLNLVGIVTLVTVLWR